MLRCLAWHCGASGVTWQMSTAAGGSGGGEAGDGAGATQVTTACARINARMRLGRTKGNRDTRG